MPLFEERAKVTTERSISPASRILTGLTSTLSEGPRAWMTANWLGPVPMAGSRSPPPGQGPRGWEADNLVGPCPFARTENTRRSRHVRRNLLEHLQPFPTKAEF